jgi:nucleotide-binding universal stress UspA family protein
MYPFKRIMVGLDLTVMDRTLIQYTAFLSYYLSPEKVYFVNIQKDLDIPDEIRAKYPDATYPRDEKIKEEMEREARLYFPDYEDYGTSFEVIEGSPRKEMLRWSHVKNIDLLLVGHKVLSNGSGIIPRQLARKVSCSILFVPETVNLRLNRVVVANDFSSYAKAAFESALALEKYNREMEIISNHVYTVPYGYYRTGKTEQQFAKIMEENAKEKFTAFLKDIQANGAKISVDYTYNHPKISPAQFIYENAKREDADMILVGARGKNAITAMFLGSVTERMVELDFEIPLLIVKQKENSFNLRPLIESV